VGKEIAVARAGALTAGSKTDRENTAAANDSNYDIALVA